jgi:hypothetical protein
VRVYRYLGRDWPRLYNKGRIRRGSFCGFAFYLPLQFEGGKGHRSQDFSTNVDFRDEGAVDGAFLGNLKEL